jgi:hypothetical protein
MVLEQAGSSAPVAAFLWVSPRAASFVFSLPLVGPATKSTGWAASLGFVVQFRFSAKFICMGFWSNRLTAIQTKPENSQIFGTWSFFFFLFFPFPVRRPAYPGAKRLPWSAYPGAGQQPTLEQITCPGAACPAPAMRGSHPRQPAAEKSRFLRAGREIQQGASEKPWAGWVPLPACGNPSPLLFSFPSFSLGRATYLHKIHLHSHAARPPPWDKGNKEEQKETEKGKGQKRKEGKGKGKEKEKRLP